MIRKLCDRVSCGSTPFRVIMKQWILAKFLCNRVYFWTFFYATGYRVLSGLPHTPVTSLVKYPPGGICYNRTWDYTLGAETFAGRNFRDFRVFWHFSRKFLPRHNLNSKFAKVFACEITGNSRLVKIFTIPFFVFSSSCCVAVPQSPRSSVSWAIRPCKLSP